MKKLTIVLFVLILAVTAVFSACGEKTPDVTTEPPATTTAPTTTANDVVTTTKAPVTTTAPATTVVVNATPREPVVAIQKVDNPDVYRELYVKDGALALMDYYSATPDMEIEKSRVWENEDELATSRFTAPNTIHKDFVWHIKSEPIFFGKSTFIKGGTCVLVFPHVYKDGSTTATNYDITDYYIEGGSYSKNVYPSYFGEGFLGLGFNTTVNYADVIKEALNKDGDAYTLQVFATFMPSVENDSVSNQQVFMAGPIRISVSVSDMDTSFTRMSAYNLESSGWISPDGVEFGEFYQIADFAPVTYTLAVDGAPKSKTEMTDMKLALYLDAQKACDSTFKATAQNGELYKIGEGADAQIYAVRVYDKALTEKEVKQNHFADMAMFFGLDVSNFAKLSSAKKTAVYDAFSAINASTPREEVVAAYTKAAK